MIRDRHSIVLLILVATGLCGCGLLATPQASPTVSEPEPTVAPEATQALPPGAAQVVFWEPFALDRPQGILLSELVRDFQAGNPDVVVELVAKSGYSAIHDAMIAALPDGELPNLAVAFPSMIAQYAAGGVVVPLDPFIADPEVGLTAEDLADIYPGTLDAGRIPAQGQQLMAFPFAQNAVGMWVNQTLLAQAGWERPPATWVEFEQACFDVWGNAAVRCYPYVESVSTLDAWLYSRGGQQLDQDGGRATFNSEAGIESLGLLRRLIDAGLAWRPEDVFGDYVAFANGQAAFTFSSTGNSPLYLDAYKGALTNGVAPFEWRQVLIPQADPEHPATALYGTSFFVVRGEPAQERAAWRLIRWLTGTQQTARWAGQLEALPVRASALAVMTDTLAAYPFLRGQVEEILPYARPEPVVAAELDVRDLLYTAIISVTQGYADPQTALDQAARKVDAVLARQP